MKMPLAFILLFLISCSDNNTSAPVVKKEAVVSKDTAVPVQSQTATPYAPVDISPMDVSYFPADFPVTRMTGKGETQPLARVIYSRPYRQGRKVFGHLLDYGRTWRMGANEATEFELFKNARINNVPVAKGRYIMYCIPQENEWTIILNNNIYSWGLRQDSTKNVAQFKVPVSKLDHTIEYFTIVFEESPAGADMVIAWEQTMVRLPISFNR